ncbi:MAG: endonuclease MutS2 [Peptoniphilaceae bacterium]|nr:endonuclease MutS2 [Peptoniphilaceae bacterium]MDY5765350.1 endonuclease MutS2 [Peptoniphilaceae bacterium]
MDKFILHTLEYDKILQQLSHYAESSLGKNKAENLLPFTTFQEAQRAQEETDEAVGLILKFGNPPLFGIYEVKSALKRAELGGVLSMGQLLEISESLRVAGALHQYVDEVEESFFVNEIRALFVQKGLEEEIANAIFSEDQMADTASHTLFSIRRSRKAKQDQIKTRLNAIMMGASQKGHLRENLITMRDGRYVLPVKAEDRGSVKGIVHDQSGSGATVFIEPMAIVELNNQIRQLELDEREEIQRILAELSMEVSEYADEISGNQDLLQYLDFTFAKAKYALAIEASRPEFTEDRVIDLHGARHPLLGKSVVPIDIRLGKDFNTLVITGPNTGGKTVTLKTLGLMQAMAQAGLQIPARSPSKVGVFQNIDADIGDKQSIEMSLSTFSASMTNIVRMLNNADEGSLLLFDEIGSGTDPTEGAAIAMAILERLTAYGIRTVATTHYSELKLFAIREEEVQNASVEFNVETLSPTYRLMIGLPGRSNAFEISRRLGLSEDVLRDAQKYLDQESIQFEDVLADIEKSRLESEKERERIARQRQEYTEKLLAMQAELDRAKKAYERDMERARGEADRLIREAQEEAQHLIRQAKKAGGKDLRSLDRTLTEINESSKKARARYHVEKHHMQNTGPENLKIGESVRIISMNQVGTVIEGPFSNGEILIRMGILKVKSNLNDVVRVDEEPEIHLSHERPSKSMQTGARKALEVSAQLDLRGHRFDEAMQEADKYLDDAVLAGLHTVRIIHGKGTGALRKGIHERLKKDRRVAKFGFADAREGGTGATDIELK